MERLYCIEIALANGEPVSTEVWEDVIDADPELQRITEAPGVSPMTGEAMGVPYDEPAAVWLKHPEGYTNPPFVFAYEDGAITALSIDRHFVNKGEEIAARLGAAIVVSGD
jgi:hypothetical protein